MVSRRNQTLQFLCLFLCRIHLTEAGCENYFHDISTLVDKPNIKVENLAETVPLVNAASLKDMMMCTLKNERNRSLEHLVDQCIDQNDLSCGMEIFGHVSFFDFLCLVSTAFNKTFDVCSHEVIIKLYSKFAMPTTTLTTTLPTTEQPQTTAKLKTTTIATSTRPPTVIASSTSPTITTRRSLSSDGDISQHNMVNDPTNKEVTDSVVYTMLGVSFILNLLLAFSVAILWKRRYSYGASMNHPLPVPISEEDITKGKMFC